MKHIRVLVAIVVATLVGGISQLADAQQVGKPVTIVDANKVAEADLAKDRKSTRLNSSHRT